MPITQRMFCLLGYRNRPHCRYAQSLPNPLLTASTLFISTIPHYHHYGDYSYFWPARKCQMPTFRVPLLIPLSLSLCLSRFNYPTLRLSPGSPLLLPVPPELESRSSPSPFSALALFIIRSLDSWHFYANHRPITSLLFYLSYNAELDTARCFLVLGVAG